MSRPAQPAPPAVAARDRIQHLIVAAIAGRRGLRQLDDVILAAGYEHFDVLESEWAKSAAQGLAPPAGQDFAAIFEGVETQLAAALTHLDPPANPGVDVSL